MTSARGDHTEYAGFVKRAIRGYGRRVADADEVDLAEMIELRSVLEGAIAHAIQGQRDRGASWADIARGTGTTRQTAQERYGAAFGTVRAHA